MKTKLSKQMNNKQLKKEISQLKQLTEILCCALYEKCNSVEEYITALNNSIHDYKKIYLNDILERLKQDKESKNKTIQQIIQDNN